MATSDRENEEHRPKGGKERGGKRDRSPKPEAPSVRGMTDLELDAEREDILRRWAPNVPGLGHRKNVIDAEIERRRRERAEGASKEQRAEADEALVAASVDSPAAEDDETTTHEAEVEPLRESEASANVENPREDAEDLNAMSDYRLYGALQSAIRAIRNARGRKDVRTPRAKERRQQSIAENAARVEAIRRVFAEREAKNPPQDQEQAGASRGNETVSAVDVDQLDYTSAKAEQRRMLRAWTPDNTSIDERLMLLQNRLAFLMEVSILERKQRESAAPAGNEATATGAEAGIAERLANVEAKHYRSLFGLHPDASDDVLKATIGYEQRQRLRLSFIDARPDDIASAEAAWHERIAALPELTNPDDPRQLAPYLAAYELPSGASYEDLQRAMERVRLQREGLPAPLRTEEEAEAPVVAQPATDSPAPAAVTEEPKAVVAEEVTDPELLAKFPKLATGPVTDARFEEIPASKDGAEAGGASVPPAEEIVESTVVPAEPLESRRAAPPRETVSEHDEDETFRQTYRSRTPEELQGDYEYVTDRIARYQEIRVASLVAKYERRRELIREIASERSIDLREPELRQEPAAETLTEAAPRESAADTPRETVARETPTTQEVRERAVAPEEIRVYIADALRGLSWSERIALRNERAALKENDKILASTNEVPANAEQLWWALTNVYRTKVEHGDLAPTTVDRMARSYRELVEKHGMLDDPKEDGRTLSLIAREVSADEAAELFYRIEELHRDVVEVHEADDGTQTRYTLAGKVAGWWIDDLRHEVQKAEQAKDRQRDVDPEYLGQLQARVVRPIVLETVGEWARDAVTYIHVLRGEEEAAPRQRAPETQKPAERERTRSRETLREAYAQALRSQSRMVGRVSRRELEDRRTEYQHSIEQEVGERIEDIARELRDAGLAEQADAAEEARLQASIVELVLGTRADEERALREQLRAPAERVASSRVREFWKRSHATRAAIGLVLTGAVALSGATGSAAAAAMIGSVSTMVEGSWKKIEDTFGAARVLTKQEVRGLSDAKLERAIAAHTVAAVGFPRRGYETQPKRLATINELLRDHERRAGERMFKEIRRMKEQGRTSDQIVEALMLHSMTEELSLRRAVEGRYSRERNKHLVKWMVANGTGMMLGGLTGTGRLAALIGKA